MAPRPNCQAGSSVERFAFGQPVENIAASEDNPTKRGFFIRSSGSMVEYASPLGTHHTPSNNIRAASPSPEPDREDAVTKKTYLKPFRTIVEIEARWADRVRDFMNASPSVTGEVREALEAVLSYEKECAKLIGYSDCTCMSHSHGFEQAYEAGQCPHQKARAALASQEPGTDGAAGSSAFTSTQRGCDK